MKYLLIRAVILLSLLYGCKTPTFPTEGHAQVPFQQDSAVIKIKDSILIGNYVVAVKGYFSVNIIPINPVSEKVFVKGYENSDSISLQAIQQNVQLQSFASLRPLRVGSIALLKTKNAAASTVFEATIDHLKQLPRTDILEEGDKIVFVGWKSYDATQMYTHPARWYKIVK